MRKVLYTFVLLTIFSTALFAQLQLKLPSEITGERSASLFDNDLESSLKLEVAADATAPANLVKGAWLVGLAADLTLPLGDFSNGWSTGFSAHAMIGYMVAKSILLNLSVGYISFSEKESIQGVDNSYSWIPIMLSANYLFNPGKKLTPFIGLAMGLYLISYSFNYSDTFGGQTITVKGDDSSTEFGIAPRVGVLYTVSAAVLLTLMVDYNLIFTSGSSTSAMGFLVGFNYALKH